MTYKTRPLLGRRECPSHSHVTPAGLVIPGNRRQPSTSTSTSTPLISLPTKLVCGGGLVVIATCIVILVVTHTDTQPTDTPPQYSVLVIGGTTSQGVTHSVENINLGR